MNYVFGAIAGATISYPLSTYFWRWWFKRMQIVVIPTGNTEIGDAFGLSELEEVRVLAICDTEQTEYPCTLWREKRG